MSVERAVMKYMEVIRSDTFAKYEKTFAQKINSALLKGYLKNQNETKLVQIVENIINSINNLSEKDKNFELSTNAIFIHGYPKISGVEFNYYGEIKGNELGDLIFIISFVFNGQKCFEKFTITQFKKDSTRSRSVSWKIKTGEDEKRQLYLLSRFPVFKGVTGSIISANEHILPNYSGCLGSYGLLYKPGDFSFVSATKLDTIIGHKNSLKINEIYDWTYESEKYLLYYFPNFWSLFGNHHYAYNSFDFAHKYLTIGIGEPTYMSGAGNSQVRSFVHELMEALRNKGKNDEKKAKNGEEKDKAEKLLKFADGFLAIPYTGIDDKINPSEKMESNFNGGGIGIVHTTINIESNMES